jgi:hypothetical protein
MSTAGKKPMLQFDSQVISDSDNDELLSQTTPLKRKPTFKVPATPMKKKIAPLPYDKTKLLTKFEQVLLDNTAVNHNYTRRAGLEIPEYTFQYLRNNFVLKLNNGEPISCFLCINGALTIYDFNDDDVDILNHLLHFIMKKFSVNVDANAYVEMRKGETQFIRADRLTTYWDKDGLPIRCLPVTAFQAKVAVKVIGLQYRESHDPLMTKQTVRLLLHLEQVQVISPGDGRIGIENGQVCLFQ